MRILSLSPDHPAALRQAAEILTLAFREHWPDAWPTMEEALEEVHEMLAPERLCRAACDAQGNVLGWIGGIPEYDGNVWELHPLAVHPAHQRRGIGRALVADFEAQVCARGGLTILLGSDDVDDMTTLAGVDLYSDLCEHLRNIRDLKGHPFVFYQKLGYTLIGVIPDANGRGKPDILMGKRV